MEDKLAAYRERKYKEESSVIPNVLNKLKTVVLSGKSLSTPKNGDVSGSLLSPSSEQVSIGTPSSPHCADRARLARSPDPSDWEVVSETSDTEAGCPEVSWLTITTYSLSALLWLTLFAVAINLEFGAVYFVISTLYLLWKNTRTGPKKQGEISAYSVFNPNCEAIDGTLKAEQFEQEIRFGAASVR